MNTIGFSLLVAATSGLQVFRFEQISPIGGIVTGAAVGVGCWWFCKHKKVSNIRPIVYWPIVGLLALTLTKGGDLLSASFWMGMTIPIGLILEWKKSREVKYLVAAGIIFCMCAGAFFVFFEQSKKLPEIEYSN